MLSASSGCVCVCVEMGFTGSLTDLLKGEYADMLVIAECAIS